MNDYDDVSAGPDDDEAWGPDDDEITQASESVKFHDFVPVCPACREPVTEDMDSCPYCGDILFRYLTDGTFAPRKGPLVKIFAGLIVAIVLLAVLGLLMALFSW